MPAKTRVLYNSDCPICNAEICHYAAYSDRKELPIAFDPLNSDALSGWGIDADTAARRLHVSQDGQITSGVVAFCILWAEMPRYRWFARVVKLPGIFGIACLVYDHILAPALYRRHLRRMATQGPTSPGALG